MKTIRTLVLVLVLVLANAAALSAQQTIVTQSVDNDTVTRSPAIVCAGPELHYWRSYPAEDLGPVTATYSIAAVRFGVFSASAPDGTGSQPATLRIYLDPTRGAPAPRADLITVASQTIAIADGSRTVAVATLATPPLVPTSGYDIVVEIEAPDGNDVLIGGNEAGETAPGYLSSAPCGVAEPGTVLALTGFNHHLILDLVVEPSFAYPGSDEDLLLTSTTSAGETADRMDVFDGDVVQLSLTSPGQTFAASLDFLVGQLFATGSPPSSPVAYPEVHVNPAGGLAPMLLNPADAFFGLTPLGASGTAISFPIQGSFPGISLMIQGFVLEPTAANGIFATTHAHELILN